MGAGYYGPWELWDVDLDWICLVLEMAGDRCESFVGRPDETSTSKMAGT